MLDHKLTDSRNPVMTRTIAPKIQPEVFTTRIQDDDYEWTHVVITYNWQQVGSDKHILDYQYRAIGHVINLHPEALSGDIRAAIERRENERCEWCDSTDLNIKQK